MPIDGFMQPEILEIDENLRLRQVHDDFDFALVWYQDKQTVEMMDGKGSELYTAEKLKRMYEVLKSRGECWFIEIKENGKFIPIGDVTCCMDDCPIAIYAPYQHKGIGKRVVARIIARAIELHFYQLRVDEIFYYNQASKALFESMGFIEEDRSEEGSSYILNLM